MTTAVPPPLQQTEDEYLKYGNSPGSNSYGPEQTPAQTVNYSNIYDQQQQKQQQQHQHQQFDQSYPPQQQQQQPSPPHQNVENTTDGIPKWQPLFNLENSPSDQFEPTPVAHNIPSQVYDAYAGQSMADDQAYTSFAAPESSFGRGLNTKYQLFLDQITPHWKARWAFSLIALFVFMARVVLSQGWYVVCYALAIYYLNLFIGFITPKIDPSLNLGDSEDGPMLPTHVNDEFKPFIRRLPEFKFWLSATQATLISLFLTLFELFDIPVFWPILLLYFLILTACTMRQQIKHMIKWKYVPWDAGKKKYANKTSEDSDMFPSTV